MSRRSTSSASSLGAVVSPRVSGRKRTQVTLYTDEQEAISFKNKTAKKAKRSNEAVHIRHEKQPIPTRNKNGELYFPDYPLFRPNLTPAEVLQLGSFGGTYFRPIYSSIVKKQFQDEAWRELPEVWLRGLNIPRMVASPLYRIEVNKYRDKCGQGLEEWENSGWITSIDPYGTYQIKLLFF